MNFLDVPLGQLVLSNRALHHSERSFAKAFHVSVKYVVVFSSGCTIVV